jgi:prephenate dehydrogenase
MSAPVLFERITIAGVGLVGGSLALAVREAGLATEVVGFGRSAENLAVARQRGLVDRVTRDPAEAVGDADAIVLAAPVGACVGLAEAFAPHARPGAVLTDVASVKAGLVAALEARWASVGPVVGAHPIAGSEASGAGAARGDLFRGQRCIVTPTTATDPRALAGIRALWEGVGARVETMRPAVHDELLARVSHLPHLVAYALVAAVGDARVEGLSALEYAGSGFRDTTRIAASPAEVWRDIALANAVPLRTALVAFRAALDRLERLVARGDAAGLEAELAAARALRQRLGRGD